MDEILMGLGGILEYEPQRVLRDNDAFISVSIVGYVGFRLFNLFIVLATLFEFTGAHLF